MSKLAIITGASSGIGAEFAKQLSAQGYSLLLIARREEQLKKVAQHLTCLLYTSPSPRDA